MNKVISEYGEPNKAIEPKLGLAKLNYAHFKTALRDTETVVRLSTVI